MDLGIKTLDSHVVGGGPRAFALPNGRWQHAAQCKLRGAGDKFGDNLCARLRSIQIFWISKPDTEPNKVGSFHSDRYKDTIPLWENGKF